MHSRMLAANELAAPAMAENHICKHDLDAILELSTEKPYAALDPWKLEGSSPRWCVIHRASQSVQQKCSCSAHRAATLEMDALKGAEVGQVCLYSLFLIYIAHPIS